MPAGNSFNTLDLLRLPDGAAHFHRLERLEQEGFSGISRLPFTIKVLLECALRCENQSEVTREHVSILASYRPAAPASAEVPFLPTRVLVQDFTGVPAMVDLAAMRSAMQRLGGDPALVNPRVPVDLIIDHSLQVDESGTPGALHRNADLEFERNRERYEFLHWAQKSFDNLRVVPPASGICHQVNLEYLGQVVRLIPGTDHTDLLCPDTLVGLDSHTTMINSLGILGWGVGGIEAEAVILGQPIYLLLPRVVGFRLLGELPRGCTATDLALTVTRILRGKGVVGCFVEFCGPGLSAISLADRATISNMAPEQGATCCFFPVDQESLDYLRQTGRRAPAVDRVERYCKEQGLFRTDQTADPDFFDVIELDLSTVAPSLAGPRRPQDLIAVDKLKAGVDDLLGVPAGKPGDPGVTHGSVVIAAITSCTNTSNPGVVLAAGLLAKKAVEAGLAVSPAVKTSLAPGSRVVTAYLDECGLTPFLEKLGFHVVGYGCTTCIGNSGPLSAEVTRAIQDGNLVVASVLSGNRNFEGRVHQLVRVNFLASPPLVVAYALAGNMNIDFRSEPLGKRSDGSPVFLRDIWPAREEIESLMGVACEPEKYRRVYERLLTENEAWNRIPANSGVLYPWREDSTYILEPPFFRDMPVEPPGIRPMEKARVLLLLGDSVTTDHISPAGAFPADSEAGRYLSDLGVAPEEFNSYGSRRGNDRVMTRGTFMNIRIKNRLAQGKEGGFTTHLPSGELLTVFQAARRYQQEGVPTVVIAGRDYGMGSSRDWAAKGTRLLGVRAVLACSFERIHRSNLIGMGVLPLQFPEGTSAASLGLTGRETVDMELGDDLQPGQVVPVKFTTPEGSQTEVPLECRIDTRVELSYFQNGGILQYVLRRMLKE